jgi:hypothetical protein
VRRGTEEAMLRKEQQNVVWQRYGYKEGSEVWTG